LTGFEAFVYYRHMTHVSNMNNRILIRQAASGATVLSGALRGHDLLAQLLRATAAEPTLPQPVFLDFIGIDVATASFLRESVLAFRDIVRGRRSVIYPVVANASDAVKEELDELVKSRGGILMTCQLADDGAVSNPGLIGQLDRKQQLTFDLVRQRGETDAMELMRESGGSEDVGSTAWNNRLSSLAALGLVIEMSFGRTKRYKPLLQGL
jgi:hypothetical protein